jgi:predicted hydrocarbon binding protein
MAEEEKYLANLMLYTSSVKNILSRFGLDASPSLSLLGGLIGEAISKRLISNDLEGVIGEVTSFWRRHKLGRIEVIEKDPLTLLVHERYHLKGLPETGTTLCVFDEAIIKSVLELKLGVSCLVKETECHGTGHDHCKFEIQIKRA